MISKRIEQTMRIGVDLGGTKLEAVALDDSGAELAKQRVATPRGDYEGTLDAIAEFWVYIEGIYRPLWSLYCFTHFSVISLFPVFILNIVYITVLVKARWEIFGQR